MLARERVEGVAFSDLSTVFQELGGLRLKFPNEVLQASCSAKVQECVSMVLAVVESGHNRGRSVRDVICFRMRDYLTPYNTNVPVGSRDSALRSLCR